MPRRRPNSSGRLRPEISSGNTERVQCWAASGDSPSRIGPASLPIQPVLRCKRRSQLPRDRTPIRPHVLHMLPCRYEEGDMDAVTNGCNPLARNALGAAEQTTGQHQGSSLMDTEPVSFHEFDPAYDRAVRRVHLHHLNTLPGSTGVEIATHQAVGQGRQRPAHPPGSTLKRSLLLPELEPLYHHRLARITGMGHHTRDRVPNKCLSLTPRPSVGDQGYPRVPAKTKPGSQTDSFRTPPDGRRSHPPRSLRNAGPSPTALSQLPWTRKRASPSRPGGTGSSAPGHTPTPGQPCHPPCAGTLRTADRTPGLTARPGDRG